MRQSGRRQSRHASHPAILLQDSVNDLDQSIVLIREALLLRPPGHSDRPSSLSYLTNSLRVRYQQRGVLGDPNESIALHRAALSLHPIGHPERSSSLNDLAICLGDRFHWQSILSDLDDSIELHRVTVALCPLATLIDSHFSVISPLAFKLDSVSMVYHHRQTWTRPSCSIHNSPKYPMHLS